MIEEKIDYQHLLYIQLHKHWMLSESSEMLNSHIYSVIKMK